MSTDPMLVEQLALAPTATSLREGSLSLVEFLEERLRRVATVESHVHALIDEPGRRLRLLRDTQTLHESWPNAQSRPLLFGVPVGVKDLIRVDGFPTRAGSSLPPEAFAGSEASAISRLKSAGSIIFGKTTTDEFAYADPPDTRNPYDTSRTPGGSSAGSAAGVACGVFPLAIGTQTSRSIIAPAAFCGVIGFKPSHGRVPTDGVVVLSPFMDTPGVLAQDLAGVELASQALLDDWTSRSAGKPVLGIPDGAYFDLPDEGWRQFFYSTVSKLEVAGFELRRNVLHWDSELEGIYHAAMCVLHGEMAREHAERYHRYGNLYRERSRAGVERGLKVEDRQLVTSREVGRRLREDIRRWMDEAGVDLLLSPSQPGPAPLLGGSTGWGATTTPWSFAGLPCITLPVGMSKGLPQGLQAIGRHGDDESLLAWMRALSDELIS